jgi:hypothetical protein
MVLLIATSDKLDLCWRVQLGLDHILKGLSRFVVHAEVAPGLDQTKNHRSVFEIVGNARC